MRNLSKYWKAILSAIPLMTLIGNEVVEAVAERGSDGTLDSSDILLIVVAALTPIAVRQKANTDDDPSPYESVARTLPR